MERCNGLEQDPEGAFVYHDDAQATIAALQARVKELEESRDAWKASQECSEKAYMALVNQIPAERFDYDPVNVALLDGAKEQEIIGRKQIADLQGLLKRTDENREQWRKLCQEAQSQLTQRTAELEAAKAESNAYYEKAIQFEHELYGDPINNVGIVHVAQGLKKERADLQAELERVRALVKALPKVEGEIEVSSGVYNFILLKHDSGTRFLCGQIETEQTAQAIAALWEHRQGMEG